MSSQDVIQAYLQKHKIGALFEDLMGKLISDQPDEPCVYLTRILMLRAEKKGLSSNVRKSMGDFDAAARTYDKPWQTNTKRGGHSTDKLQVRKSQPAKPEWNPQTKSPTAFDDFWSQDPGKTKDPSAKSSMRKTMTHAWADAGDEDLLFRSQGYTGPARRYTAKDDSLNGEFPIAKPSKTQVSQPDVKMSNKAKGHEVDVRRHKRELEAYVLGSQRAVDSGIEEEDQDIEGEDGVELLENVDDLAKEGVKNAKKSGVRVQQARGQSQRSNAAQVKVSICARCAQVMGAQPSSPLSTNTNYDVVPDLETHRGGATPQTSKSPAGGFRESGGEEEEFESVSQVTGPRQPFWQESDNEATTPRKGEHMFASNMSPAKGYPMYSADRPSTSGSKNSAGKSGKSLRQTWSPGLVSSDDDAELQSTGDWQFLPEEDTDASSIYGAVSKGKKNRGSYQGAF